MFQRRRSILRTARAALAAFVLLVLTWTPIAVHAHAIGNGSQFAPDFCTAIAPDNVAAPPTARPDHDPEQAFHCGDCAGCAGGSLSPPVVVTPALVVSPVASVVVAAQPLPVVSHDGLVARPRGPPLA